MLVKFWTWEGEGISLWVGFGTSVYVDRRLIVGFAEGALEVALGDGVFGNTWSGVRIMVSTPPRLSNSFPQWCFGLMTIVDCSVWKEVWECDAGYWISGVRVVGQEATVGGMFENFFRIKTRELKWLWPRYKGIRNKLSHILADQGCACQGAVKRTVRSVSEKSVSQCGSHDNASADPHRKARYCSDCSHCSHCAQCSLCSQSSDCSP